MTHEQSGSSRDSYYRTLFDAANEAMLVIDPEAGTIVDANRKFAQWFEYSDAQWRTLPLSSVICESPETLLSAGELRDERQLQCEAQSKTGRRFWIKIQLKPIAVDDRPRVLAIIQDITEYKQIEATLLDSEKHWRSIAENVPDFTIVTDRQGTIQFINKVLPGYDKKTIIGMSVFDFQPEVNHESIRQCIDQVFATGEIASKEIVAAGSPGELRHYISRYSPIKENNRVVAVLIIATDITERELSRQALQRSQIELKERNLSLATINTIADRVFRAFDLPSIAREAVQAIEEYANAHSIGFYTVDKQGGVLNLVHTTEPSPQLIDALRQLPIKGTLSGRAVIEKTAYTVEDILRDDRVQDAARHAASRLGYVSGVFLPAIFQNEVLAVLIFAYKETRKFSAAEFETLMAVGKSIGLALANARHISQLEVEIRERKLAEETLRNIAIWVSAATGDEFFRSLVLNVVHTFGIDYAFLGELDKTTNDKIKTTAVCAKGAMAENFEYALRGTPCEGVVTRKPCVINGSVREKFPQDTLLQEMAVESYAGTPLRNSNGEVIGVFVAMNGKPLANPELIMSTLQIFAVRAAAELERLAAEAALRSSEEHLRLALNASHVGTWEWDIVSGAVKWSQNVEKLFRAPPGSFKGNAADFFELMHPDDVPAVKAAVDEALKGNRPYAVEHRIKSGQEPVEGECWIYCQGEVYRDESGEPTRMLGTVSDISERKNAELQTKASQKMLQLVLDSIPARVFWKDLNSTYLGCNKLFAMDAGVEAAPHIVGKTDDDLIWRSQAEHYRLDDREVIRSGIPKLTYEETIIQKDKTVWVETSKIPLTDLNGKIIGVLGTYNDISERKRALEDKRRSEQRLKLHFQQTPLAVIEWNSDKYIVEWNRAAERIFGYRHEEAVGRNVLELIVPKRLGKHFLRSADALLHDPSARRSSSENITKDGRTIMCDWYSTPLVDENGQLIGVASAAMDITERVNNELELSQYREHLEELVAQRTEELTRVNKELEAFSYSVSHDLRAPLRSIDGFSQVLLEDYADSLDQNGKDYLQRVRHGAQRMAQLIDDMLKLSRLTRSHLQHEDVNISELAADIAALLRKECPERSAEFHIQPDLWAHGDEGLLTVVMDNLISNAWKYTGKKSHAVIEIGASNDGKETTYWVKDNGAGFSMKYADKLFTAFQRLHHPREFEGSGIGLATVARIIHRHGGSVWAQGEEDQGAAFYFTLPNPAPHPR